MQTSAGDKLCKKSYLLISTGYNAEDIHITIMDYIKRDFFFFIENNKHKDFFYSFTYLSMYIYKNTRMMCTYYIFIVFWRKKTLLIIIFEKMSLSQSMNRRFYYKSITDNYIYVCINIIIFFLGDRKQLYA